MKKSVLSDLKSYPKEKRNAYAKVLDFIDSDRCYDGKVCVLYGLCKTGNTTIMKQIMANNKSKHSFMFLEAEKKDTIEDVYSCLDEAVQNNIDRVFIDEITNVPDLIDNSAVLADIYAKEGIRIVLAGTDSLSFVFAENHDLFGRTENISTTYISFEEHCRVLGAKDMDEYIRYGGLMKKGHIVDHQSARQYLDDAVSGNIFRSIQQLAKYSNDTELSEVTFSEMRIVIEKMVEKYSGVLNTLLLNEELKKIVLAYQTDKCEFKGSEDAEIFEYLRADKTDTFKEFAEAINADTGIIHKFNDAMVSILETELIRLNFISATNEQEFVYDETFGWRSSPVHKNYYLIQPAVKYYHLQKSLDFVRTNEYYNGLSEAEKQFIMDKLDSKIKGEMTKQIVVFETFKALSSNDYFVCKVSFSYSEPNKEKGEYDMLVYDKKENSYSIFEISHTDKPYEEQYKHLINKKFKGVADHKYGKRENVSVLYNGKSFKTMSDVLYLNITDFVKEIARCKNVKTAMQDLSANSPIKG